MITENDGQREIMRRSKGRGKEVAHFGQHTITKKVPTINSIFVKCRVNINGHEDRLLMLGYEDR